MVPSSGVTELLERFGKEKSDSLRQGTRIERPRIVCNLGTHSILMSTADDSMGVNSILDMMSLVDLKTLFSLHFQYMNSTDMNQGNAPV